MGSPDRRPGLRERKKTKTREAIRHAAVQLVGRNGYAHTTVEHIAEAADISPATFFRYFPSKGSALIATGLDAPATAALASQPPGVSTLKALGCALEATKSALSDDEWNFERSCIDLAFSIPELRELQYAEHRRIAAHLAEVECRRLGRDPDDFEVHVFFGALVGAVRTALDRGRAVPDFLFEALEFIGAGMPLQ